MWHTLNVIELSLLWESTMLFASLEERRNRQDLIEVFKMCNRMSQLKLNEFFTLADNNIGTRGHSRKLVKFMCTRDCCKYFFSNRVINRWNQLDQRAVEATASMLLKVRWAKWGKQGWASSWTDPPSPGPPWWVFWPVRPHKVSDNIVTFFV